MEWVFPAAGPLRVDLELPSGGIEVTLAPTDEIRVLLEPVGPMSERAIERIESAEVTCDDSRLVVVVPNRKMRDTPLRLAVLIPEHSELRAHGASADVSCSGVIGNLAVRTASGDVKIDGPCDVADFSTASGDVRLTQVLGECHVKTASGDVVAEYVGGPLIVTSASGDVLLGRAGSDVKVRTASGDVRVANVGQGELSVNSASGDVIVGVAGGVGTWLDVTTVSGTTRCSLPAESSLESDAHLRIIVRTVSGDVRIQPGDAVDVPMSWAG